MNESETLLNLKLNCGIVFYGKLKDLNDIISELEYKGCKVIFVKKTLRKIFIEEERDG